MNYITIPSAAEFLDDFLDRIAWQDPLLGELVLSPSAKTEIREFTLRVLARDARAQFDAGVRIVDSGDCSICHGAATEKKD
jgi:hypothetical protein